MTTEKLADKRHIVYYYNVVLSSQQLLHENGAASYLMLIQLSKQFTELEVGTCFFAISNACWSVVIKSTNNLPSSDVSSQM